MSQLSPEVPSNSGSFVGVQFSEEDGGTIAVIHKKWLTPRKKQVWWPPYKHQESFNRSLKKGDSPDEAWTIFSICRTFFEEEDYNKACQKIKKAELTSEVTSDDGECLLKKRNRLPPKRLYDSDSESEEDIPQAKNIRRTGNKKVRNKAPSPTSLNISDLVCQKSNRETGNGSKKESRTIDEPAVDEKQILIPDNTSQCKNNTDLFPQKSPESQIALNLSPEISENNSKKRQTKSQPTTESLKEISVFLSQRSSQKSPRSRSSSNLNLYPEVLSTHDHTRNDETPRRDPHYFEKKIVHLLLQIKEQNKEVINLLKLQQQNKTASGQNLDLPTDIPVTLPLATERDLRLLEDNYLSDSIKLSALASYFATLGGINVSTKTYTILKKLMTNKLACGFSFRGTRMDKKPFESLKLRKVVINAVLSVTGSTQDAIDNATKEWLKHAPKRVLNEEKNK